jgi:hypothetical protein
MAPFDNPCDGLKRREQSFPLAFKKIHFISLMTIMKAAFFVDNSTRVNGAAVLQRWKLVGKEGIELWSELEQNS